MDQNLQIINFDDYINLPVLIEAVKKGRFLIFFLFVFSISISLYLVMNMKDIYTAKVTVAYAKSSKQNNLSSMASSLVLGGMSNIFKGSSENGVELYLDILRSWHYQEDFIFRNNLQETIANVDGWDKNTNKLIFKKKQKKTVRKDSWNLYEMFNSNLNIISKPKSGTIIISFDFYSPDIANKWLNLLINDFNEMLKKDELNSIKKNISYLKNKLETIEMNELKSVFYNLLEQEFKREMMTDLNDEYILKIIVPSKVPQIRAYPNRSFSMLKIFSIIFFPCIIIYLLITIYLNNSKLPMKFNERS